jgi:hypothetical protein
MSRIAIFVGLSLLACSVAQAQDVAVVYGPEETIYGSCRPALTLTNKGQEPIDYVQVDVRYQLRDGRVVMAEQKSRYLHGVANPVAPGASRVLVIHHDEATPFGAACSDVTKATVSSITCRTVSGANCDAQLSLRQDGELALPRR